MDADKNLFQRSDSILMVVDVQDNFLSKLDESKKETVLLRIGWLMKVAKVLNIPIMATVEQMSDEIGMTSTLKEILPKDQKIYNKLVFSFYSQDDIRQAFESYNKREVVLVGLETDVCIAHSAIELVNAGYRVSVIEDATGSPSPHHSAGLHRMEQAGVIVTNSKGIYYEWIRDIPSVIDIQKQIWKETPPGLVL